MNYFKRSKTNKLYRLWGYLKDRCLNPKSTGFKNYGARGIGICEEWLNDFDAFAKWAIANGWKPGLDLDRKENSGNYSPSNCRFVTRQTNCNNKRNNVKVIFRGVAFTVSELSRHHDCNVSAKRLAARLRNGWPVEKAVCQPVPDRAFNARINQLAADSRCQVSRSTIIYRINELGWSEEQAAFGASRKPWLKKKPGERRPTRNARRRQSL